MSARRKGTVEVLPPEARHTMEVRIDAASCRVVACAVRARLLPLVMPDVLRHLHDRAKKGYFSGSVVVEDDGECPVSLVLEAVAMELLKLGFLVRTEIFETDRRHYREQRPGLEVDWGGQAS